MSKKDRLYRKNYKMLSRLSSEMLNIADWTGELEEERENIILESNSDEEVIEKIEAIKGKDFVNLHRETYKYRQIISEFSDDTLDLLFKTMTKDNIGETHKIVMGSKTEQEVVDRLIELQKEN